MKKIYDKKVVSHNLLFEMENLNVEYLNTKEAARFLKVSVRSLFRFVSEGTIPFYKPKGRLKFEKSELVDWMKRSGRKGVLARMTLTNQVLMSIDKMGGQNKVATSKKACHYGYGSVYQRKKTWTYDFYVNGKRIQKAVPEAESREEALHILLEERIKSFDKPHEIEERREEKIGFRDFASIYHEVHMKTNRRNFKPDTYRLQTLCSYFKDRDLRTLTPLDIERFRASRLKKGNSKSTVNRYIQLMGKMLNLAVEEGYLEKNPARKVKPFSEKDTQKERILTEAEEEKLKENSSPNLKPIITHALNTGMRRAEILGLTWNQVDLEARMIKVERTKSGRVRYIPINDDLFKQFLKLKSDNGESPFVFLNPETKQPFLDMKTPFKRACRISGIEGMRFHDLRHTFASRLVANGIDIETVRDLLGHHSIVVTQRYVHSSDEQKRKAVEILNKKTEKKAKMVTKMVTIENQSELIS